MANFELNYEGVGELLRSDEMMAVCRAENTLLKALGG